MTMNFFRLCTILALGFAASQTILSAQEKNGLDGIWSVSVIVTNCQTGAPSGPSVLCRLTVTTVP
jgi:hypothetical protein